MGLDAVEIVLRTEELFAITIKDDEVATVRTVGRVPHISRLRCGFAGCPTY